MSNRRCSKQRRELAVVSDKISRPPPGLYFLFFRSFSFSFLFFFLFFSFSLFLCLPDDNYISISESSTRPFEFLIIVPNSIHRSHGSSNSCPLKGIRIKSLPFTYTNRPSQFENFTKEKRIERRKKEKEEANDRSD